MSKDPKWFKLGGFRMRDFRTALDIEEDALTTVNRVVKLQLKRIREEYDVLARRKAKLDKDMASGGDEDRIPAIPVTAASEGDDRGRGDTPGPEADAIEPGDIDRHKDNRDDTVMTKKRKGRYTCGHCGKHGHNARTCPESN